MKLTVAIDTLLQENRQIFSLPPIVVSTSAEVVKLDSISVHASVPFQGRYTRIKMQLISFCCQKLDTVVQDSSTSLPSRFRAVWKFEP